MTSDGRYDETAPVGDDATRPILPDGHTSAVIDDFRLLEKIGEGGMGEVWLADQEQPVRRRVALKLIKAGMDTRHVVARFESERQALAMMSHPAIARVYDAGATAQGRPYFAMEYVQGEPLTDYCDRHRLNTDDRLDLFVQVCAGVQHAHQKGLIHRDLKPSNVLVTVQDDRPVPKIIDFGVAKATQQRLTDKTMHTQIGVMIGTPAYMSPEQAELTGLDVDTRTDVYALGVLLYELLVGRLPFDTHTLGKAGFDEVRRIIREDEPARPSTRFSTLEGPLSDATARPRRTDPPSLRRELRGDLDWITMRALEKERTRRYGSPNEMAADIRRHLEHRPVLAGPPGAAYRATKFVRRHRFGVLTGSLIVVALVVAMAGTAYGLVRSRRSEAVAREVTEFMVRLFSVSDPSQARGETITAREILDRGAREIETLDDQPLVQAQLMSTMGRVYRELGLYEDAQPLLEGAPIRLRDLVGVRNPDTLRAERELAFLYHDIARYDEARELLEGTLEAQQRELGAEHPETLRTAAELAMIYDALGREEEAVSLLEQTLETQRVGLGREDEGTLKSMHNLGLLYSRHRRDDEAEPVLQEVVEIRRRVLGDDHPDTLKSQNNLARTYRRLKRYDEAERLLLQVLEAKRATLGEMHPSTLSSRTGLANLYSKQNRWDEAETHYLEIIEQRREVLGPDHPDTLTTMEELALDYAEQEQFAQAEPYFRAIYDGRVRALGETHPHSLWALFNLACLAEAQKRPDATLSLLTRLVDHGFAKDWILADDAFPSLEGRDEFERLLEIVRERLD